MKKAKAQAIQRPSITDYHDYKSFLSDWLDYLSDSDGISLRKIAQQASLASGYLPMVLSGKRSLSAKALQKIFPHLKLSRSERRYFELLHTIGESEIESVRLEALDALQRFPGYRQNNSSEVEVYKYLTRWFYVAIRELSLTKDFSSDPSWIKARLRGRLSQFEVEQGLEFLKQSGFLIEGKDGKLKASEKRVECKEGVYKISLSAFHRQMLDLAAESIESVSREKRSILGHSFALRQQDFAKVSEILDEALNKIEALEAQSGPADSVYHVELAAFPLTQDASNTATSDHSQADKKETK